MPLKINEECIGCGTCVESCSLGAIIESGDVYLITDECDECSACIEACPVDAIIN